MYNILVTPYFRMLLLTELYKKKFNTPISCVCKCFQNGVGLCWFSSVIRIHYVSIANFTFFTISNFVFQIFSDDFRKSVVPPISLLYIIDLAVASCTNNVDYRFFFSFYIIHTYLCIMYLIMLNYSKLITLFVFLTTSFPLDSCSRDWVFDFIVLISRPEYTNDDHHFKLFSNNF